MSGQKPYNTKSVSEITETVEKGGHYLDSGEKVKERTVAVAAEEAVHVAHSLNCRYA
jgi:hypothetical protein